ncbi:hypothetical protein G6F40_016685 [Rhizopus arrhizus]|nr:hypothetical protein G6F40_016685 [Rhizopus arrhizus]
MSSAHWSSSTRWARRPDRRTGWWAPDCSPKKSVPAGCAPWPSPGAPTTTRCWARIRNPGTCAITPTRRATTAAWTSIPASPTAPSSWPPPRWTGPRGKVPGKSGTTRCGTSACATRPISRPLPP